MDENSTEENSIYSFVCIYTSIEFISLGYTTRNEEKQK